ncbi:hypothetical protein MKX03_024382, partial [Papaver bracteatum]
KSSTEMKRVEAKFLARETKYGKLKKKLKPSISNLTKYATRIRNETLKDEVTELDFVHDIPFPDHNVFEATSPIEGSSYISDSDIEQEDSDEEDYDSEASEESAGEN